MNTTTQASRFLISLTLLAALSAAPRARAQTAPLLIPGQPVAVDVPGAHVLPDPNTTYKVVFDIKTAAEKPSDPNPLLVGLAKYVNTLAKYGVPASHRQLAVVFHGDALNIVVNNDTWKAAHNGADNPNVPLIQSLAKAGVQFHVCGQGVMRTKIDPKTIQPEIQLDLWALTTLVDLEQQGYVHIGD
jgi:intracellular sulfur oxidation DsrE/DsrF family protein